MSSPASGAGPTWRPGWYPDPMGRFDYRYHDGEEWTATVSDDGRWMVDHVHLDGDRPSGGPSNAAAAAALVCGMVSMALGWLPVVFVGGFVLAGLALVLGAVGFVRSRRVGAGRGFAVGGMLTGVGGVMASSAGLLLTATSFGAVAGGEPGPHEVVIERCEVVDGEAVIAGALRNDGSERAGYVVTIEVSRPGMAAPFATVRVPIDDIDPGDTAPFAFTNEVRPLAIECAVADVVAAGSLGPWGD
jgi:Protein of unknown function (DUF2510)